MERVTRCCALGLLWSQLGAMACGPYFPNAYVVWGEEYRISAMPEATFYLELDRIFGGVGDPINPKWRSRDHWGDTLKADLRDLRAALAEREMPIEQMQSVLSRYEQMRMAMKLHADDGNEHYASFGAPHNREPFDLRPYEKLLSTIPSEFGMYVRGAALFRAGDNSEAVRVWQRLLALPPAERRYRSTWAMFMTGKALALEFSELAPYSFAKTRDLAATGFHDTLELGTSSLGWEARHYLSSQPAKAFGLYADMYRQGSSGDRLDVVRSLYGQGHAFLPLQEREHAGDLIRDAMCREILAAWLISHPKDLGKSRSYLAAVGEVGVDKPIAAADRLAWAAYDLGEFELAQRWLDLADPAWPVARWVRAKLWLREGRSEDAIRALTPLAAIAFAPNAVNSEVTDTIGTENIAGALGVLQLTRGNFMGALDTFLRGTLWLDAAYVAERLLTLDELETYVTDRAQDPVLLSTTHCGTWQYPERSWTAWLKHLLGRRLARDGQLERAVPYFPDDLRDTFTFLVSRLKAGRDRQRPNKARARSLLAAGLLCRRKGMGLLGTELDPDWSALWGSFDPGSAVDDRVLAGPTPDNDDVAAGKGLRRALLPTRAERERFKAHSATHPKERFHYRYYAAELMWECASLLPDNQELTAKALYYGGTFIADRDPEAADRFYKALVRRCRKLPVAQRADLLRWFPESFDVPDPTDATAAPTGPEGNGK